MHEVLVNRLGGLSLPRKSVVRLTDCPDMTLDAYRGRKTAIQQQQQITLSILNAGKMVETPDSQFTMAGIQKNIQQSGVKIPQIWGFYHFSSASNGQGNIVSYKHTQCNFLPPLFCKILLLSLVECFIRAPDKRGY